MDKITGENLFGSDDFVVRKYFQFCYYYSCPKRKECNDDDCKKSNEYFIFHPRRTRGEFLELIEQSDIILDSLNWSGGSTSLDAISLNKPIVTCPSEFMRGRVTYSFL